MRAVNKKLAKFSAKHDVGWRAGCQIRALFSQSATLNPNLDFANMAIVIVLLFTEVDTEKED